MPPQLAMKKHAKYFQSILQMIPSDWESYDDSRIAIAFFAISGLDVLNCLNYLSKETKLEAIDWIYRQQLVGIGPRSGFRPSIMVPKNIPNYQCGHLAMTYLALGSLLILEDDLSKVDKKSILEGMRACQKPDGTFSAVLMGGESDMRFLYCACCISAILNDWSGMDKARAIDYILNSISYDGAIGQGPGLESHGGSTFCAVASLCLMNELHNVLTNDQLNRLRRWCLMRQDSGFHGRPGKPSDTCYSFWVGATLQLLDFNKFPDPEKNRAFVLTTQNGIIGGFAKFAKCQPDPHHTYLGLCGLSLAGETGLSIVNAALNITDRAYKHLLKLHDVW
ncbi:PREDICTED: geranylgeranyl transferase type-1 subunit beta [Dufourea novaeangliae]|uniref:Geranylgeranyl transferase type-1 subunit beta n=1 Tax=Dufourea novaeangliae TaxID=178035 RepID=A0A154P2P1_DUFNO|nr:PREDICTED: geranylgeranyl transferase type-1 subunit beta [Dufourea novaeangliae]KZC05390.1 Geranylgeranyl transferase type-1 subunit beta [Dufourea novaeangliae]